MKNRIDELCSKYESHGNPGVVSSGKDDLGGKSYGCYQITNRRPLADCSNLAKFVGSLPPPFQNKYFGWNGSPDEWMNSGKMGTFDFDEMFTNAGIFHPEEFSRFQLEFIMSTHYEPTLRKIRLSFLDEKIAKVNKLLEVFAIQSVCFSLAVQHGPNMASKIFLLALKSVEEKEGEIPTDELIEKIYQERSKVEIYFKNSPALWTGIKKRFNKECADALLLMKGE